MKVSQWLTVRLGRLVLLASVAIGWAGVVFGASTGQQAMFAVGAGIVALTNLVIAKALMEARSSSDALARVTARSERALTPLKSSLERLQARTAAMESIAASMQAKIDLVRVETPAMRHQIVALRDQIMVLRDQITALGAETSSISRDTAEVRNDLANLETAHDITRTGLVTTRALTDKVAERTRGTRLDEDRLNAVATSQVATPLLSLAIPSFNRPYQLAELLASIATEVATCPDGLIEVCITDDASPDPETLEIALEFAESHRYASLRVQPANVGLERNVMAAAEPCQGQYLMLVGNDDLLAEGALPTILGDIQTTQAPVLLYGKRRINLDGSPRADVAGTIPIDLAPNDSHVFPTLVDAAKEQGLLSTFGFLSTIVLRRRPFFAVDPEPYVGHTLYARALVLIAAFSRQPVFYRNVATVVHRTPTQSQKHGEALGRQEEEFMSGGDSRLARYFGTSLAAMLQRLIDRNAIDYEDIATIPERLMTRMPLVDWIARNRNLDPAVDHVLGREVVADANRFHAAYATIRHSAPRVSSGDPQHLHRSASNVAPVPAEQVGQMDAAKTSDAPEELVE